MTQPKNLLPALGLGMVAGATLTMMLKPKKPAKHAAGKAIKAVGEVVENISEAMHM